MTREYYEINEDAARQAKAMWSHSDYVMGSKTEEYKKAVEEIGKLELEDIYDEI